MDMRRAVHGLAEALREEREKGRIAHLRDNLGNILFQSSLLTEEQISDRIVHRLHDESPALFQRVAILKPYRDQALKSHDGRACVVLSLEAQAGYPGSMNGYFFPVDRGLTGRAYSTERPVLDNDIGAASDYFHHPDDLFPVRSEAAFPIMLDGSAMERRPFAVLNVESSRPRAFSSRACSLLECAVDKLSVGYTHLEIESRDFLTRLYNRNRFTKDYAAFLERSLSSGSPLGMILLDVNDLKEVNDRWTHPVGDSYLRAVASGINAAVERHVDRAYRIGGDEFVLLLPGTPSEMLPPFVGGKLLPCIKTALRQEEMRTLGIRFQNDPVSTGFGELHAHIASGGDSGSFFKHVDMQMYAEKKAFHSSNRPS